MLKDRTEAGRLLGDRLWKYRRHNPVVLSLLQGGVPVGCEVAKALHAPMGVLFVRKINAPFHPEITAGAVVDGDYPETVLNRNTIKLHNIPPYYLEVEINRLFQEIEQRRKLYGSRYSPINLAGKTIILACDGVITGATLLMATKGLRKRRPEKIVITVPGGPEKAVETLKLGADDVISLNKLHSLQNVNQLYKDNSPVSNKDIMRLINEANSMVETSKWQSYSTEQEKRRIWH